MEEQLFVYSKVINIFLREIRLLCLDILKNEFKLETYKTRFLWKKSFYPLSLVVFEGKHLGFFDYEGYQIGVNKWFFFEKDKTFLKNVLRHELIHYLTFLKYGPHVEAHGNEFRESCREYGYGPDVWKAKEEINWSLKENQNEELRSKALIEKVKKLLSLASSDNKHESQLAALKARELILKNQLEDFEKGTEEHDVYVKRVIKGTRNSAKYHTIYEILKSFFVAPIFNYIRGGFYIEVIGSKINVEMASYVASFLDHELERLFLLEKKQGYGGTGFKSSFMRGVLKGYQEKSEQLNSTMDSHALIKLKGLAKAQFQMVYPRSGKISIKGSAQNNLAFGLGQNKGRNLEIRRPISGSSKIGLLNP